MAYGKEAFRAVTIQKMNSYKRQMELIGILICHSFSSREQLNNYTACEERECNTSPHYRSNLSPFPFNVSGNEDISDIFCFDHNLKAPEAACSALSCGVGCAD